MLFSYCQIHGHSGCFICSTITNSAVMDILKNAPSGSGASPELTAGAENACSFNWGTRHPPEWPALSPHPSLTWQRGISVLSASHRSPGHWWIWCICQRLQKPERRACSQSGSAPARSQWPPHAPGQQTRTNKSCLRLKNKWIDSIKMGENSKVLRPW